MAEYKDYLPGGSKYTGPEVVVDKEIDEAEKQQKERKDSTSEVNWEDRYKNLEQAFSKQGQQIGDYRKLIDEFVTTTPDDEAEVPVDVSPITPDDIYEDPDAAVRRAVDSHPAIAKAKKLEEKLEAQELTLMKKEFNDSHPDFELTVSTEEFGNWVKSDPVRTELAMRANGYDMISADALFRMWEAENAKPPAKDTNVDDLSLETSSGAEPPAPERYSRSHMLQQKILAKQGVTKADTYVKAHAKKYREALAQGLVRD